MTCRPLAIIATMSTYRAPIRSSATMAPAGPLMASSSRLTGSYPRTGMTTATARINGKRYRGRSAGAVHFSRSSRRTGS